MEWIKDLYISPKIQKRKIRIKWRLQHGAGVVGAYILVIPYDSNNQIEIINSAYFKQKYYRKGNYLVIGIAENLDWAYEIITDITKEVYKETKDVKLKEYLLKKHRMEEKNS